VTRKNKRLLMGLSGFAVVGVAGYILVLPLASRFEPYIREQASPTSKSAGLFHRPAPGILFTRGRNDSIAKHN